MTMLLKPKNLSCGIVHLHSESDRTCLGWILDEGYATPIVYNLNYYFFLLKIVRNGSPRRRKNIRRTSSARKRF